MPLSTFQNVQRGEFVSCHRCIDPGRGKVIEGQVVRVKNSSELLVKEPSCPPFPGKLDLDSMAGALHNVRLDEYDVYSKD